jgi:hypothetical protein
MAVIVRPADNSAASTWDFGTNWDFKYDRSDLRQRIPIAVLGNETPSDYDSTGVT